MCDSLLRRQCTTDLTGCVSLGELSHIGSWPYDNRSFSVRTI